VKLGLEDKKKTMWAAVLGVVAILAAAYVFIPMFTDTPGPASNAQAAAPAPEAVRITRHGHHGKKEREESLDPTLRLDLLAAVEQTQYRGNGRNIFVSQAEVIPQPLRSGVTDQQKKAEEDAYRLPQVQPPPPIPLRFYGFASQAGEPKRVFLELGEDVFVAGEGEIVDRRYKVIRISPNSVEIQDMVYSGPPQSIPLTQGQG
jgi:hypothetical protein